MSKPAAAAGSVSASATAATVGGKRKAAASPKAKRGSPTRATSIYGLAEVIVSSADDRGYCYAPWNTEKEACPRADTLRWDAVRGKLKPPTGYAVVNPHPAKEAEPCAEDCSCGYVRLAVGDVYMFDTESDRDTTLRLVKRKDEHLDDGCDCRMHRGVEFVKFEFRLDA
jgi:hypothetical protein